MRRTTSAGPVAADHRPALSVDNPNNPTHTAGTTFMGQFLDHDMTFDTTSQLGMPTEPTASPNARTPAFDLDSVYGGGPIGSPQLYDPRSDQAADRDRRPVRGPAAACRTTSAIIADPRNDENMIIAGLHAAFILLPQPRGGPRSATSRRRRGQRLRRGAPADHVALPVDDPARVPAAVRRAGDGGRHPGQRPAFLQAADRARRSSQSSSRAGLSLRPQHGPALLPRQPRGRQRRAILRHDLRSRRRGPSADPADLRGGARAPRRFIGWQTFFDFGDGDVKPNKRIDTQHLDAAVQPAAGRHRRPRPADGAAPAQPAAAPDLVAAVRPGDRRCMGVAGARRADLDELSAYGLGLQEHAALVLRP